MAQDVAIKGFVGRQIPDGDPEHFEDNIRIGRYQELYSLNLIQSNHLLADEGSYFIAPINNGVGTGLAQSTPITAFADSGAATACGCYLNLKNNGSLANSPNNKRLYLDYIKLIVTSLGGMSTTAAGTMQIVLKVDNVSRATGGTTIVPLNINMDASLSSKALVQAGAIALTASSTSAITVGRGLLKLSSSATTTPPVIGDVYIIKSGLIEGNRNGTSFALAGAISETVPVGPIVVGPQQNLSLQIWYPAVTTVGTGVLFEGEVCWYER